MAMILSVAIMGVPFAWMDFIGMVMIVGAVTALSVSSGKKQPDGESGALGE